VCEEVRKYGYVIAVGGPTEWRSRGERCQGERSREVVDVRAGLDEQLQRIEVAAVGRDLDGIGPRVIAFLRVGALVEKQLDRLAVAVLAGREGEHGSPRLGLGLHVRTGVDEKLGLLVIGGSPVE